MISEKIKGTQSRDLPNFIHSNKWVQISDQYFFGVIVKIPAGGAAIELPSVQTSLLIDSFAIPVDLGDPF